MALAQTKPYRISRLTQENGMYFENQGPLRLTNSDWKLLIYVKLDNFNQRTKDTMDFYKRTLITCNDLTIAYEGMFKTTCDNFKLTSNSLEREVSRKRFYMLQSIDETDTVTREKRGLVNLVGRVQKTLFGTLDDTDAELYDKQIEKLQSSQQNLLKIIDKQTSVLKATANTFKEANRMEAQINRLGVLYNRMADTVNQTVINLDIVEARTNINEQINILNLLFQQLSFETDTICEIIIAAQGGIMHSSVIAVNELRQQLKDISLIVPKEQSLPFNLNQVSLYELSKISKFNIIYKNETLIFEIVIPLVNSVELTLYHVIPLPVVKNDHYIHIIPEYSYIAISKTHEYYLTLCMNHLMLCRQTNMGTLCPETQPVRLGASELPCEVELFVKPSSIPISCPIHYLDITRSIYHRLKYQNAWIYTIKTTDNVAVSCENRDQAINIQLTGNEVLTLNEDCRGYTPQMVLTPSRHLNSTHYKDLISDVGITTNLTIPATLKQKISSGNTHTNSVIKLTDLGQYSKSIEEIEQLIQEEKDKLNSNAFYNTNDVDPIADFSDDSEVEDEVILPNDHSSESELSVEEEHSSSPQSVSFDSNNTLDDYSDFDVFMGKNEETFWSSNCLALPKQKIKYIELDNEFRSREFKTTTRGEILALIGILFYMATCKTSRANAKSFWKTDGTGMVLFRAAFSYNRFFFLLQCLRFDDLDTRVERQQSDKLAAVREMYTIFNDNNMKNYSPSEFVTIDEMLYAFRGRCSFIQYMPAKPAKYGMKLYALCDAKTFYVYNFEIYCGKQKPGQFLVSNKPFDIVMRLIEPLKTSKRNLTTDNYYGSYPLAQELLKKGITLVTTLKKNKTDIPPGFLPNPKRKVKSSLFGYQDECTLVSYVPKKNKVVILLSTMHDGPDDINEETGKPEIIHDYNKTKSGIDTVDQKCSVASTAGNTRRWPLALFFRFLDITGVNSHILYVANNISMYNYRKFRRLPFLQRLATNLLEEHLKERAKVKGLPKDVQYFLAKYKNENVCSVTQGENLPRSGACHACGTSKNNKTTVRCSLCTRFVCKKYCTNIIKCHSCQNSESSESSMEN
ncbi:hypothetical protein QTP88_001861 [Uroleucon formosanum]